MAFVDLCRLCGTDTLNIARNAIFEGEGRAKNYALKISDCLTLRVTEVDQLPKIMCGECSNKLESLSAFREKSCKTAINLLSLIDVISLVKAELPYVGDGPDSDSESLSGYVFHLSSPEPELEFKEDESLAEELPTTQSSTRESEELPDENNSTISENEEVDSDDLQSSSPELESESETEEEESAAEKRPSRKAATKRSLRESEVEALAIKRARQPKPPPAEKATPPPKENSGADGNANNAVRKCQVCHKQFPTEAKFQRHLRSCVNTGKKLRVQVQRLTEEQLLALDNPTSDQSQSHECQLCGVHLKNALFLKSHVDLHSTPNPGQMKCAADKCTFICSSSVELKEHRKVHVEAGQMSCDVCGKIFTRKNSFSYHMQRHTQLKPYACDFIGCSYSCKIALDLQRHKKRVHVSTVYTCNLCEKNIKSLKSYRTHITMHKETPGSFKCLHPRCKQLFKNADALQKHTKKVHRGVDLFQCDKCGSCFFSLSKFQVHKKSHFDKRPFKCEAKGCTYTFKTLKDLVIHKENVHKGDFFLCCYCNHRSSDKVSYGRHLKKHKTSTSGVFKCLHTGCQETFSVAKDLKTHSKLHKTECDVAGCSYTSTLLTDLRLHRASEHSIWQLNCQLCGKGCNTTSNLNRHMKRHETDDPEILKCTRTKCLRTFSSRTELKKHMKGHIISYQGFRRKSPTDLEFPKDPTRPAFECRFCGKVLSAKAKLQRHLMRHETETPCVVKCVFTGCKQTFTSADALRKHADTHRDNSEKVSAANSEPSEQVPETAEQQQELA